MTNAIQSYTGRCPSSRIALFGYSQVRGLSPARSPSVPSPQLPRTTSRSSTFSKSLSSNFSLLSWPSRRELTRISSTGSSRPRRHAVRLVRPLRSLDRGLQRHRGARRRQRLAVPGPFGRRDQLVQRRRADFVGARHLGDGQQEPRRDPHDGRPDLGPGPVVQRRHLDAPGHLPSSQLGPAVPQHVREPHEELLRRQRQRLRQSVPFPLSSARTLSHGC